VGDVRWSLYACICTCGSVTFVFDQIDGMDSSKLLLPHLKRRPKETLNPDYMLKMNLACVKYNGLSSDDLYYFNNSIPKDSNTTCSIIWLTLFKVIACYCSVYSNLYVVVDLCRFGSPFSCQFV
jgi:hypothetical protein